MFERHVNVKFTMTVISGLDAENDMIVRNTED